MRLAGLSDPQHYQGLYAFDFGEWTAFGYTAEEIAMLLESERFAGGKVYRICRVGPDGHLELKGVARERFQLESGMFFWRHDLCAARQDFEDLCRRAEAQPPPGRCFVHLAELLAGPAQSWPFVVALIYPAEYEEDMGRWLLQMDYGGGDFVEGGISLVTRYYEMPKTVLDRRQLWSARTVESRTREEVYASVRRIAQR